MADPAFASARHVDAFVTVPLDGLPMTGEDRSEAGAFADHDRDVLRRARQLCSAAEPHPARDCVRHVDEARRQLEPRSPFEWGVVDV